MSSWYVIHNNFHFLSNLQWIFDLFCFVFLLWPDTRHSSKFRNSLLYVFWGQYLWEQLLLVWLQSNCDSQTQTVLQGQFSVLNSRTKHLYHISTELNKCSPDGSVRTWSKRLQRHQGRFGCLNFASKLLNFSSFLEFLGCGLPPFPKLIMENCVLVTWPPTYRTLVITVSSPRLPGLVSIPQTFI